MKGRMTIEHSLYYAGKEIRLECKGIYDANGNRFDIHFYRIDATTDAETLPPPFVIPNYKRGGGVIKNVVLVQGKKGLMKIATNIPINRYDVDLIENLPKMYGKRWGIETGYRVKKREGLVKTTSNNYSIRLFYFLFSVALYNLWILINLLVLMELGTRNVMKRVVTFKLFLKSLYEVVHT